MAERPLWRWAFDVDRGPGEPRDLVLLAHPVDDQWAAMTTAGNEGALAPSDWVPKREKMQ
jgi:hypothetical protein